MGKRFLQVILVPEDCGPVRRLRVSTRAVQLGACGLLALALALFTSLAFHLQTFRDSQHMAALRAENSSLREELHELQGTVAELESGIDAVGRREREARLLAGLDPFDAETRQLGIGGQAPAQMELGPVGDENLRAELVSTGQKLDLLQRHLTFQVQSYEEVLTTLRGRSEKLARTPTICPVQGGYTLSSGFGARSDPFTGRWGHHNGLDLRAAPGTPVIGTADGTVSFVGPNGDYGLTIQVDHGDGLTTVFCHLDSALVRVGDPVRRGTPVGTVGSTGRTTGPHLHYEVWLAGRPVDPSRYILTLTAIVD